MTAEFSGKFVHGGPCLVFLDQMAHVGPTEPLTSKSVMMTAQLARRSEVRVYANGAIEAPIQVVREGLERRAWCFRNRARMDLLLELMRLNINNMASQDNYSANIREHLKANGGRPTTTRKQWDPLGTSSLRR